jgi:hypothetical protein
MNEPIRDTDHAIHRSSHLGYESENTYSGVLSFMRRATPATWPAWTSR